MVSIMRQIDISGAFGTGFVPALDLLLCALKNNFCFKNVFVEASVVRFSIDKLIQRRLNYLGKYIV